MAQPPQNAPQPTPSPQDAAPAAQSGTLIAGHYAVDIARPLASAGGGLPAFAVTDRRSGRGDLMAVQVPPDAAPRAHALNVLALTGADAVLTPIAHGPAALSPGGGEGRQAWFVISRTPPGPPIWQPGAASQPPWPEAELLECLLRPAAEALDWLAARHVTHRAIRPDNLFRAGRGQPVALGAAWSAPHAMLQPALFEPPYSAMCLPAGRGPGRIADDVYALGVMLLCLALGRLPLAGLDDAAIIRRKLELGSYAALAGDARLPASVSDLVRGMLAEDPEHRPPPLLLSDPASARSRRVAARPPRRAQLPLSTPAGPVWNSRTLAHAIATHPEHGARLLRSGEIDRWLRRSLGDATAAVRIDEALRLRAGDSDAEDGRADATLTMRAVALLDPLAPLAWRGLALWPDGLGPALVGADKTRHARLADLVTSEAISSWAAARPERSDPLQMATEAHQLRAIWLARGAGGAARLRYALNPLLACASPNLGGRLVVRLAELLPALEAAAASPEARRTLPIDGEIAAFIAARQDAHAEPVTAADSATPQQAAIAQLRQLAALQQRERNPALPNLAGWLAEHAGPALAQWRQAARREALTARFAEAARLGRLGAMLAALDDPGLLAADAAGARAAQAAIQAIDRELAMLGAGGPARAGLARRLGRDITAGVGLSALTVALIAALLG